MKLLYGTLPAMLTPYDFALQINAKEYARIIEFGLACGLNGIFCNGSAGDGLALEFRQKVELMQISVQVAKGGSACN